MSKQMMAFALGGGGARGPLQVGALRALLEAGIRPHLVVGTSIGALNATFLGIHGFDAHALNALEAVWRDAAAADLLPAGYLWLAARTLFGWGGGHPEDRMLAFLDDHGITSQLSFGDLKGMAVRMVTTDLTNARLRLYGADPKESVLEGVLASAALPPWVHPLQRDDLSLLDGGALSNLPIEPALSQGATEIVALDLSEPSSASGDNSMIGQRLVMLFNAVQQRQTDVESAIAQARGVTVRHMRLRFPHPTPVWDFSHTNELLAEGYLQAKAQIAGWRPVAPLSWRQRWFERLARH